MAVDRVTVLANCNQPKPLSGIETR